MKLLPNSDRPTIIRTDFSDDKKWQRIRSLISAPVKDWYDLFYARVAFVNDLSFDSATKTQLINSLPEVYGYSFLCVADSLTMSHPENPISIVDLYTEVGREFRALPRTIQAIENNLSIANMDFHEFADSLNRDGIFRGFE